MTEADAVNAITQRWITAWEAAMPISEIGVVPFTFEGEVYEAPAWWARVTIAHSSSRQITAGPPGTRRFERRGNVFVQLFGDQDAGRLLLDRLVGVARDVLEARALVVNVNDEPVTLYEGVTREVDVDRRWLRATLVVAFDWYETR